MKHGRESVDRKETIIFLLSAFISLLIGGVIALFFWRPAAQRFANPTKPQSSPVANPAGEKQVVSLGVLDAPKKYQPLADYLRDYLRAKNNKNYEVVVNGYDGIPYQEAKAKIAQKEWDIVFTYSPMLSMAAKDNGYEYSGLRMFPDREPYYSSAIFVRRDSPINSLADLNASTKIALGDFNSASSFYMPVYDLYGKTVTVTHGHRGASIREMVLKGLVAAGAGAYERIKDDPRYKLIHISRKIPGPSVYLSPQLSPTKRQQIKEALVSAPANIKSEAEFGESPEVDYTEFRKITQRVEAVLGCADFTKPVVKRFCGGTATAPVTSSSFIQGKIEGFSVVNAQQIAFNLITPEKRYRLIIDRQLLTQAGFPPPLGWQGKNVTIYDTKPNQQGELIGTSPQKIALLGGRGGSE
ncbi:MAG: PhnD/SsuA/transferrin family substrate-binding protein [Pseudanabaenaceae cyanobacterium SKYGB_i_bin29]|nr:phosphate/phosphite/phosphonate ABC transporter substrate-binding protein [Pseudanabaenaceae cyanobacterium SKYG29]MDW8422267.1 PhnD/SsuA/transferrin family substrate-binding protein [Pseudanabaenaceae cyanobacterium SKYGB_i_bin29]